MWGLVERGLFIPIWLFVRGLSGCSICMLGARRGQLNVRAWNLVPVKYIKIRCRKFRVFPGCEDLGRGRKGACRGHQHGVEWGWRRRVDLRRRAFWLRVRGRWWAGRFPGGVGIGRGGDPDLPAGRATRLVGTSGNPSPSTLPRRERPLPATGGGRAILRVNS